mgnify:CR=1 FL=1
MLFKAAREALDANKAGKGLTDEQLKLCLLLFADFIDKLDALGDKYFLAKHYASVEFEALKRIKFHRENK